MTTPPIIHPSGVRYHIKPIHIDLIRVGDTIEIDGDLLTVSPGNLKKGGFYGTTLWGDSYRLGRALVNLAVIETPRPPMA